MFLFIYLFIKIEIYINTNVYTDVIKMENKQMEIKDVQRIERRSIPVTIRILPSVSKFLKENNVSPTIVFDKAVEELMNKK